MTDGTDAVLAALVDLKTEMATRLGQIGSDLGAKFDQMEASFQAIGPRLDRIETRLGEEEGLLSRTRADVMARIDRLQGTVQDQRDDLTVTYGSLERIERAIGKNSDEVDGVRGMVRTVSADLTAMGKQFGIVFTKVRRSEARLDAPEGKQS